MDLGLSKRHALITGASSGIGFSIASALAAEGCRASICGRDRGRIETAADEIGHGARGFVCDLGDEAARSVLVDHVAREVAPIDILVINTGGPPSGGFKTHSRETWRLAIDEHLGAAADLVRDVTPGMKERRWGRIVAVTSCFVKQPEVGMVLSNSVRAAIVGFLKTVSQEIASFGVTANNVMPGYTETARLADLARKVAGRRGEAVSTVLGDWTSNIPAGRLAEPHEPAAAVAFLCSEVAGYITGVSLPVDGGWNRGLI